MAIKPAIIAAGRTRFGEHYEKEPEKLIEEAWLKASQEANIERKSLQACYLSDYFLPITNKLGLEEGFLSELTELHVPMEVTRSFDSALSNACHAIQAGKYELVLIGGMEKMTDRWDKIRDDLMLLEDPWSYYAGGTPEANHELMLRAYARKHSISRENQSQIGLALAHISVKNHANAAKNEYAQYQRKITVEQVLNARKEARKPLGLYDFAPVSDGASVLLLASQKTAEKYSKNPVFIHGLSSATDYLSYSARKDLTHFLVTKIAMDNAVKEAGIKRSQIRLVELYDQSTLMEMVSLEDLGFCKQGTAWRTVLEGCQKGKGCYEVDQGEVFVNTDGGLKADGNPLGATGGAQIFEIYRQLNGKAGERQIRLENGRSYGCALELEGFGTKGYVCILGRN